MDLQQLFTDVKAASRQLTAVPEQTIRRILLQLADAIPANTESILEANRADLAHMDPADPKYDRLTLTPERLQGIASDMRNVASLPSPLGIESARRTLPNGLELKRVSVPFGVIGVIYEARPNVTFDVFSLCLMAGSAVILKGGHQASNTNRTTVALIRDVLTANGIDPMTVALLPDGREASDALLRARGFVDLIIPRGSAALINHVIQNALVPVIETGAGVCHAYMDADADTTMAADIVTNAKTRRVSVCNALDCLLIDRKRLTSLPEVCQRMTNDNVMIYADDEAYSALEGSYPSHLLMHAGPDSFGTEFLGYKMAIRTVNGVTEAIDHINRYGSGHSECIITGNDVTADRFMRSIDAACVYHNAPTSFTDGAQFGMGAEIGISTQKLHARGPMALNEITTYKWLIKGNGQTRPK